MKSYFLEFAEAIIQDIRSIIIQNYRNNINVSIKKDKTFVTNIDKEIEQIITNKISKEFPEHQIIGEEHEAIINNSDYKWIIDPIDGTNSFIVGRPIFGTLIGLLYKNQPIMGLIYQAITNELWIADNHNAYYNNHIIEVDAHNNNHIILATTSPDLFSGDKYHKFNQVKNISNMTIYGGDCYNYGLLCINQIDVIIESDLKLYDILPIIPVIKSCGAIITDWNNQDIDFHNNQKLFDVVVTRNKKTHNMIINELK